MSGYFDATSYPTGQTALTLADADALALKMLQVGNYTNADDVTRAAALAQASIDVDGGLRYQGRKYDALQLNEFPRVPYDSSGDAAGRNFSGPLNRTLESVWDWDTAGKLPIVPPLVLQAVIIQASYLLKRGGNERKDAIHDGLASQSSGPVAESYRADAPGAQSPLTRRAFQMLQKYRLRQGRIL